MGPHTCYCEPFAGGAALLFAKPPSPVEILNDLDQGVVGFFRVLRDPLLFQRLHYALLYTPWSRADLEECERTWKRIDDPVERVRRWFVVVRQSFTHEVEGANWFCSKKENQALRFAHAVHDLALAAERLRHVQVECSSFDHVLRLYDDPETLFYCDPPYLPEVRVDGSYTHEMTAEQHEQLLEQLCACRAQIMLSGYPSALYDRMLRGLEWRRVEKTREMSIGNSSTHRRSYRTECVWIKAHRPSLFFSLGEVPVGQEAQQGG